MRAVGIDLDRATGAQILIDKQARHAARRRTRDRPRCGPEPWP